MNGQEVIKDISEPFYNKLRTYQHLLEMWQKKINLVSSSTLTHSWDRHFVDSLQFLPYLPETKSSLIDLGSGAGFPGLVLAIARSDTLDVTLVESDLRKCVFLETVSRETKTPVIILRSRIESLSEETKRDVVTARGLASLPLLLEYAFPFLKENGAGFFLKGESVEKEIQDARKKWEFSLDLFPSLTDPRGRILKIKNLKRIFPDV